ncbi:MAG: c-type cytochrome [Anaerolineae bacterium]
MRRALLGVALVALLLPVAACSGGETPAAEGPAGAVETMPPASAPEVEAPPTTGSEAGEELAGDAIRGGQLYDKWWTVLGQDPPEGEHPLWSSQSTNTRTGADTWRCKECHGWDYKGADGAYGSGSHATGFAGVMAAHDQGTAFVLGALKGDTNPDHDFSTVMDEQALTDLAVAIAEATVDDDQFVGSDKAATAGGDLAVGEDLYGTECADCHGPEGLGFNFGNVTELEYVGGLAAGNPWEFIHKMRFGQPGEDEMPSAIDNGWTDQEMLSVLTYAQSLPNSSPLTEGGQIHDNWTPRSGWRGSAACRPPRWPGWPASLRATPRRWPSCLARADCSTEASAACTPQWRYSA